MRSWKNTLTISSDDTIAYALYTMQHILFHFFSYLISLRVNFTFHTLFHFQHTLFHFGWDNRSNSCTRAATSQLSLSVSSQRFVHGKPLDGFLTLQFSTPPHSKCDAPSQLCTPDSQPGPARASISWGGGGTIFEGHITWIA